MIGFTAGAERADQSLRPRCEDGATRFTCNVSLGGSSSREPRSDATCPDKPARVSMVESNGTRNPSRFFRRVEGRATFGQAKGLVGVVTMCWFFPRCEDDMANG